MQRIKENYKRSLLFLGGDILIILLSLIAAYFLRFGEFGGFREKFPVFLLFVIMFGYLCVFYFFDLYSWKKKYFSVHSFLSLFIAVLIASLLITIVNYVLFLSPIGRGILIISDLFIVILAFSWRNFCQRLFKYIIKPTNVIIVGEGEDLKEIARVIESRGHDFKLLGIFSENGKSETIKEDLSETGRADSRVDSQTSLLLEFALKHDVNLIVLAPAIKNMRKFTKDMLKARLRGIDVIDVPEMYQYIKGIIPLKFIPDARWFLKTRGFSSANNSTFGRVKRILDFSISSIILLLSLPLWPFIALLIKLNSKGPVFYKQDRIGKHEAVFSLHKFRSMIEQAEEDEPLWADKDDKRITGLGKTLRKLHLDELPQLWDVIRGNMSLVGPRPERPRFVEELKQEIPHYSLRHFVKPGMTGWAQVNYPYTSTKKGSREKLEFDLYYVANQSLLLDLKILLKTAQIIFLGKKKEF